MILPMDRKAEHEMSEQRNAGHVTAAVSVIVPAHNAADTIRETLQSLLAQNHGAWEAIVIDDGSTDLTADIVAEFTKRDPRFRLIRQKQGGEAAARNAGIPHAIHPWLMFLDADDWISPMHLEFMTRMLLSRPELDGVHCRSARVSADGTYVPEKYIPPEGDLFAVLARRAAFPVHACIVRKSLVEAVGCFDASLVKSPDWDLWQRIARTGAQFGHVNEILAFYRMRPSAASLDADLMMRDGLRVLRQGHAPDARVINPHPQHANGSPPEDVKKQEFYLLCWCAGLVLGTGNDARSLLNYVKEDHFPELSADAVAQCIFDAAPLPTCRTPEGWERLAISILQSADDFLSELQRQSKAPDLAHLAGIKLRKMILEHSPAWRQFIEEYEENLHQRQKSIEQLQQEAEVHHANARQQEEAHQAYVKQQAEAYEAQIKELEADCIRLRANCSQLSKDREEWRNVANDLDYAIDRFKKGNWTRLGQKLGLTKIAWPNSFNKKNKIVSYGENYLKLDERVCWLRCGEGSAAKLLHTSNTPYEIRIADLVIISNVPSEIQFNVPQLTAKANQRYRVRFHARADAPRHFFVGFSSTEDPWENLGLSESLELTSDWQEFEYRFTATKDHGSARIHFDLGQSDIPVDIAFLAFREES